MTMSKWSVSFRKKAAKAKKALPRNIQDALALLVRDLEEYGPVRGNWQNYSKLVDGTHHCHLNYRYVACWEVKDGKLRILEVYYVGTRENAPY